MDVTPILVTQMPCALAPLVPTHVPVMLDTLEMELLAQVIVMIVDIIMCMG